MRNVLNELDASVFVNEQKDFYTQTLFHDWLFSLNSVGYEKDEMTGGYVKRSITEDNPFGFVGR